MKIKFSLFFLTIIIAQAGIAQGDWSGKVYQYYKPYPGYIITLSGDTTRGYIEHNDRIGNQKKCVFYSDPDNKKSKKTYDPDELKGYMVADKHYRSVQYSGGLMKKPYSFVLVATPGRISQYLYYTRDGLGIIEIRKGGETDAEYDARVSKEEIVWQKEGEDPFQHANLVLGFKKKMAKLLEDYPELAKKVEDKEKGYGIMKMYDIVKEYNEHFKK